MATSPRPKQRKIGTRSCDACKIRKVRCTQTPPCNRCIGIGIECTFNKTQSLRGPRSLRAKTREQIQEAQRAEARHAEPEPEPEPEAAGTVNPAEGAPTEDGITVDSLVFHLCIYRLRLYPVWPIIAVEEVIAALQRDPHHVETRLLAIAVGAATMAQLKLDRFQGTGTNDIAMASSLAAECQRIRASLDSDSDTANLNSVRTAFFLHIYYENQRPGDTKSLLYLREAITLAPALDDSGTDEEARVLPAFQRLVNLFCIFDQSRAFEVLQDALDNAGGIASGPGASINREMLKREMLNLLVQRLQDEPARPADGRSDVQTADIVATRQWMKTLLWRATLFSWGAISDSDLRVGPIQIAQEFLDVISVLPAAALEAHGPAIEFKVYEIASAVADSDMRFSLTGIPSPSVHARHILLRLQKILATCRGGNNNLLRLLAMRVGPINSNPYLIIESRPSHTAWCPRVVEEVDDNPPGWGIGSPSPLQDPFLTQGTPSSPWLSPVAASRPSQHAVTPSSADNDTLRPLSFHRECLTWATTQISGEDNIYPARLSYGES